MGTIFGREGELGRINRVLDSAQSNHLVRAIRILGPSGVGKTALATAGADAARDRGWLVASAQCFRLHSSLPLFLARRLGRSIVDALHDRADRYRSGLDLESDSPEKFEEAFYRLTEAVTLDFPLALIIDDAQWSDQPSRDLLVRTVTTLADRPIALVSTERNDETSEPAFTLRDEAIAVGELPKRAVEQLVRAVFPQAEDEVISSIVTAAGSRAVDVVSVAEAARDADASTSKAVSISTRSVIARDIAILDAPVRAFLQTCALIEEPIDFALLLLMWPQDELLDLIGKASGRYLIEDEGELRFVHAAIMEAVHETIPIEIPYRYRIIEALKKLPSPRLEDYERLAQQAAATRDAGLERETLLKLAQAAAGKSMQTLAADAMERALRIAAPSGPEIVPFFAQLSQLYNVMGREADCVRVCYDALALARDAKITVGIGAIVASLVIGLWHMGRYAAAREEYERYRVMLSSDADRAQLLSAGAFIDMHVADFEAVKRAREELQSLSERPNPFVQLRLATAEAFTAMRLGDEPRVLELIATSERLAQPLPPLVMTMPRNVRMLHAISFQGIPATEHIIAARQNELSQTMEDMLLGVIYLARGQFLDLREYIAEALLRRRDRLARRLLMTSFATAAVFDSQLTSDPLWRVALEEVAHFHSGERSTPLLPLVTAWLAAVGPIAGANATTVLDELIDLHARPFDNVVFPYPFLLSIAAQRLNAKNQLRRLAEPAALWSDKHPWSQAQNALARGLALAAIAKPEASSILNEARERFETLGMPYFVQYTSSLTEPSPPTAAAANPNKTTRREREVAALVAEGRTNREIAQELVLSERTVEGHIANLFAKVNVGSRTQLAAWYLKTTSSVASLR